MTPIVLSGVHLVNWNGREEREALVLFVLMTLTMTTMIAFQKSSCAVTKDSKVVGYAKPGQQQP